jgi:DNA-binding NarL/FixJ family response regulator
MKKSRPAPQANTVKILQSIDKPQPIIDKNIFGAFGASAGLAHIPVVHAARYFSRDNIVNAEGKIVTLSEREFQILKELNTESQGKAIAFNLNISVNTLNQHLRSIY